MPKYLSRTSYTAEGLKGLLKDGGTKRKQTMERLAESLGAGSNAMKTFAIRMTLTVLVAVAACLFFSVISNAIADDKATQFADHFLKKTPAPDLVGGITLEWAMKIQADYVALISKEYGPPIGYKAGLTNVAVQERFGVSHPLRGTLLEKMMFPPPFGEVEAFYTSGGTSTLPHTYHGRIQHLDYKTIRYPGHCIKFKAMIDLDFTSEMPIKINGKNFSRRKLFEELLQAPLTYQSEDVVLIRITAQGQKNSQSIKIGYQAIEYPDKENNLTAMMRTTAFPAALTLEMLTDGRIAEHGVLRQEQAIPPDEYIKELEKRNIKFDISEEKK